MINRYPAEWETQISTWLSWPHNPQNWGKRKAEIEAFYSKLIQWVARFQMVNLLVPPDRQIPESLLLSWKHGKFPVIIHSVPTNDIWIRDYGPFFMEGSAGDYQVKFEFNAWGEKFPPWDCDNAVPQQIARLLGQTLHSYSPILEGGAMEFDGAGIGMTTLDCLVGAHRNSQDQFEKIDTMIRQVFGLSDLIVLPQGLHGDHTDGHIDNVARFLGTNRIVMCSEKDPTSPNHAILNHAKEILSNWAAKQPNTWFIDELPMPPQREYGDEVLPASYMNFIFVNGGLLVPTYDSPNDQIAIDYFKGIYPDRMVEGINCQCVIEEGGSLHCMSKQQPA